MKPKVKFCGMTRSEDIVLAEQLSVDFIGFVFVSSSPRSIAMNDARKLRKNIHTAQIVGVFADEPADQIRKYADELQLDFIQLHCKPDVARVKVLARPVIQAFRGVQDAQLLEIFLEHCPYVLIDKKDGDNEVDFDAVAALPVDIRDRLFLAGGLTPGNVRMAADRIKPYAVDCARGIESKPGHKNLNRMVAFFQALS